MNLRDLRYLTALAEHKHFGRAAEASFASQPTLSTQIKKLEDELDVQLFERQPRNLLLTRAGEAVVARARVILREVDGIREIARSARDPEAGRLRLGMFPTLGPYLLPHVVPAIRARFPKLELRLIEEKTEELLAQLERGDLDVILLALPVADENFVVRPLFDEAFVLAVPSERAHEFPGDANGCVRMSDLRQREVLLLEEGHCLRDQALSLCELNGAAEKSGFRATSLETLRQMVAANVGVTLLPQLATLPPVAPNAWLELRNFVDPPPQRSIGLIWRKSDAREPLMQALAELLSTSARLALGAAPAPAAPRRAGKARR
jgi:LysR family hydrogen peroxide-inducible transcriptional activator